MIWADINLVNYIKVAKINKIVYLILFLNWNTSKIGSIERKELRNEGETLKVKIRISKLCFWQTKKG